MQIEASRTKISELEEQIRQQPMSSKDAQELHQNIEDSEDMLNKNRAMQQDSIQRVSELQMQHNRCVCVCVCVCMCVDLRVQQYNHDCQFQTLLHWPLQVEIAANNYYVTCEYCCGISLLLLEPGDKNDSWKLFI